MYRAPNAAQILYELLQEREAHVNISHRKMPTMRQHKAFIRSKPYAAWYLIEIEGVFVGSIYLTRDNEIGIFVFHNYQGLGSGTYAVKMLMDRHPRRRYLANINPENSVSIKFFRDLGFTHCQSTYELRT